MVQNMFSLSQLHIAAGHFWNNLQSTHMSACDIPEPQHSTVRWKVLNDKFSCILEGDTVAEIEEPLVELLKAYSFDESMEHIHGDMKRVVMVASEQFPDAGLDLEASEVERLQAVSEALEWKSDFMENMRVNAIYRNMEKKALKAQKFLNARQVTVEEVRNVLKDGVIQSKAAAQDIEAAN